MDAAAAATRRGTAQMLKEARIFLPARPAPGVIHRNEFMQRVVRHLAVDLLRGGCGYLWPDRLATIRGVGAKHRHHLKTQLLSFLNQLSKACFATHPFGHAIVRIIPVIASVPRRKKYQHTFGWNLRR